MRLHFFIVDDDPDYADLLRYQLKKDYNPVVDYFDSGAKVLEALRTTTPDLILLDVVMPGMSGLETLKQIKSTHPDLPVAMVSAQSVVSIALEAIKLGAYDYVTKGHDDSVKIRAISENVHERAALSNEIETLRNQLPSSRGFYGLIGESQAMLQVFQMIRKTLKGDLTVAIVGESGTGKELVAHAIHHNSRRRRRSFVLVNCAAIPRELMESEFFGHEKGSFTGAHARKVGKFEQADGGTIFLDEVGELDLSLQAKLLRVLQNRELQRVGGNETITVDVRIICATNKNLIEEIEEGNFREDLYYRLFQFPINLPPLAERDQDVLLLAEHFRKTFIEAHDQIENKAFSSAARRLIADYPWPGNVRQLKNAVERALLISDDSEISADDLMLEERPVFRKRSSPSRETAAAAASVSDSTPPQPVTIGDYIAAAKTVSEIIPMEDVKKIAVQTAYELCNGNINQTASKLGVTRSTIYRLLRKYELVEDEESQDSSDESGAG